MSQEVELVEKVYKEIEDLYKDLNYKIYDISRVIEHVQEAKDSIDTYSDETDSDTRREVPWYLLEEYNDLQRIIEKLEQKKKETYEYKNEVEKLLRYSELVKQKFNGKVDLRDLENLIKIDANYGYITIKNSYNVHLASAPYDSNKTFMELMNEAIDLSNIKGIIMGLLINMNIAIGRDMYEGKSDEIRDYIESELRDILNLFQAQ